MTSGLPALSTSVISCTDVAYDPTNANRAWCAFWGERRIPDRQCQRRDANAD